MSNGLIVVATPEEISLVKNRKNILITGVGALNVINALRDVPRDTSIFNIGYAGSNVLKVGSEVSVGRVRLYHPNVNYTEQEFELFGNVPCFTSTDFVLDTDIKEPCVFDMELAFILALGFRNVTARKVVSDNLSLKEYKKIVEKPNGE